MNQKEKEIQKHLEIALRHTAFNGDVEAAEKLLQQDVNVNAKDKYGNTALMIVVSQDHLENMDVFDLLLQHKADVNAKNEAGLTALMWAADVDHFVAVQRLWREGADLHAKDNLGRTAYERARDKGYTSSMEVLGNDGVREKVAKWEKRHRFSKKSVTEFLKHYPDVQIPDKGGKKGKPTKDNPKTI